MCGITAVIGREGAVAQVYRSLTLLQNRGYDSAGIASLNPETGALLVTKYASQLRGGRPSTTLLAMDRLEEALQQHPASARVAMGHTRWATHGGVTDENAHPHCSQDGTVAVIHNGIIENCYQLRDKLVALGYHFRSQTDTEVIAHLIAHYRVNGLDDLAAIEQAIEQLEGTWGLVIMIAATKRLYLCKKGSPLIVGYERDFAMVASETCGFANQVKQHFSLPDHKILVLEWSPETGVQMSDRTLAIADPTSVFTMLETVPHGAAGLLELTPAPYPHWMLKEIMEQVESSQRALNYGGRLLQNDGVNLGGLAQHRDELLAIEDLIIIGCGTSWHAALLAATSLQEIGGFRTVQVKDASEFVLRDLPASRPKKTRTAKTGFHGSSHLPDEHNLSKTGVLVLSQSGETKDVHRAMELMRTSPHPPFIFAVVNVVDSLIAREARCGVYLNAGREVAVASTKSFTSQVLVLMQIAVWFAQNRQLQRALRIQWVESFRKSRQLFAETLHLANPYRKVLTDELVPRFAKAGHMFLLGRGPGWAVALEGALKIKEIACLAAEGYPGGSLKHGPFALISTGTPIILFSYQDDHAQRMDTAAIETRARGAYVVAITSRSVLNERLYDQVIRIPDDPLLSPLLSIIPLQLLAYELALARGCSPDYPPNLAKVVTVDG